jgi:very-short-patch-repair endonuclease
MLFYPDEKKRLHNVPGAASYRRDLRSRLTPAEAYLWNHLKGRKLKGRRFNRQHGIGPYTVDFYCASEKLIIELDGEVHNTSKAEENDARRTKY